MLRWEGLNPMAFDGQSICGEKADIFVCQTWRTDLSTRARKAKSGLSPWMEITPDLLLRGDKLAAAYRVSE